MTLNSLGVRTINYEFNITVKVNTTEHVKSDQ